MDNQNDPNSLKNQDQPSATPPSDTWPTPPASPLNSAVSPSGSAANDSTSTWPPSTPWPSTPIPTPASSWPSDPVQPNPAPAQEPTPSDTWPVSPQSAPSTPDTSSAPMQPEPTLPPSGAGPTPTFTPPTLIPSPDTNPVANSSLDTAPQTNEPQPTTSPLDNPWGTAPSQNPSMGEPQPTTQPSWNNTLATPTEDQSGNQPPIASEAAPTDLSHLISNTNPQPESAQPAPETLVAPSDPTSNPVVPNLPPETHKGIPRWLIGLGGGLLILVVGASAYFILGIGQPTKTTSLPATTAPENKALKPPVPIATPAAQPSEQPAAGSSANFGEVGGNTQPQEGTTSSTIETLRRRSQQGI